MIGLAAPAVAGAAGAGAAGATAATTALMYTAIATSLLGAGVGAYGAMSSAAAQKKSADYNAALERQNAGAEVQQSKFDASQISDATRRNVAMQRAAMASSGFDANSGTFSDVTFDTKRAGEMNRLSRLYQGALGVNRSMSQSQLDVMQGSAAETAGMFSAGSTILGGFNQATTIAANPVFRN